MFDREVGEVTQTRKRQMKKIKQWFEMENATNSVN